MKFAYNISPLKYCTINLNY